MKKFLSVLLSLAMLMSMLVVPVAAEEETAGAGGAVPVQGTYVLGEDTVIADGEEALDATIDGSGDLAGKTATFTVTADEKNFTYDGEEKLVTFHIYAQTDDGTPIQAFSFELAASEGLELAAEVQANNSAFCYAYPAASAELWDSGTYPDSAYSVYQYTADTHYFGAGGVQSGAGVAGERTEVLTIMGKVKDAGTYTLDLTNVVAGNGAAPSGVTQQFQRVTEPAEVTVSYGAVEDSNLSLTASASAVTEEDSFTVTVNMRSAMVSSFTGHLEFNNDMLKCVGITTGAAYDALATGALSAQLSTPDEANSTGKLGWGFAYGAEAVYAGGELLTVQFKAIGSGTTNIGLYEISAGTSGFKGGNGAAATVEIETRHVHELTKTEAVPPTATEPGNTAYWTCSGCGKYFGDAAASIEIEENSWVLQPLGDMPVFTATPFPAVYNEEDEEYVIDKSGKPIHTGDIVAYQIAVSNNPGMNGFKLFLDYDKAQLELVDRTVANKFAGMASEAEDIQLMGSMTWFAQHDTAKNGTVVTLFFTVTAESGTTVEFPMRVASCMNEAKVELGAQVIGNATAVGHVFSTAWSMDADNHWHVCEGCDAVSEQAAHSWAYRDNNDGTHDCFCKICGYVESTEPHLSEDGWQNDDGSHWKVCDDCGAVYESESHSLSCTDNGDGSHNEACDICGYVASTASHGSTAGWHKDEGGHWRVCDYCGAEYDRDTHMMDYADNGNGTHSLMCDVCGYVEETATHSSAKWHEGEGRHWKVCDDCGAEFTAAAHTLGYEDNTNNTHSLVCSVCRHIESTSAHVSTGSWESAEATHWKVCDDCGAVFAKAVHDFAYQANTDGTHSLVCRVCGFVKETAAHSSDVWETDGTDHWKLCGVCGTEFDRGAHRATGEHTATCVAAAVCDVCGVSYGEADAENHDYVYGVVTPATPEADGEMQKECSRCHAMTGEPLTYNENGFNMSIGKAVVHRGTIKVPVSVANNPGINGLKVTLQYDKAKLRLVGASLDEGVPGLLNRTEDNITWASGSDSSRNGTMFLLEFEVLDSTEASDVSITVCYEYDDVLNAAKERLQFGVMPGEVHITAPGDIDGDGVVDIADVSLLLRYYSAIGTGIEVSIVPGSQDVDGDDYMMISDVSTLLRYYSALGTPAEGTVKIY